MSKKEHVCRFNDGEQTCACYEAGRSDERKKVIAEILELLKGNLPTIEQYNDYAEGKEACIRAVEKLNNI